MRKETSFSIFNTLTLPTLFEWKKFINRDIKGKRRKNQFWHLRNIFHLSLREMICNYQQAKVNENQMTRKIVWITFHSFWQMSWKGNRPETMVLTTTTTTTITITASGFGRRRPRMIRIILVLLLPFLISRNDGLKVNSFKSNNGFSRDEASTIIQVNLQID